MQTKRNQVKRGLIQDDTALLPYVVADNVIREAVAHCSIAGTRELADKLANDADRIYQRNDHFAKRMRGKDGREYLYAFMRHWLSADLGKRGITVPAHFANGLPW